MKASKESIILIEAYGRPSHSPSDGQDGTYDGERNLSISCHELRYIRRYLLLVGQWYPATGWSSLKKNLYHVWQAIVTLGVWAHFVYSFGLFGVDTLETEHLKWFPISAIEDIVWESRWVMSHHLGLYYFCRCRHLEKFLEESWLTHELWRQTSRYLKRICIAMIVLVFCIPVALRPAELFYSVEPQDMWKVLLDTTVLAIDRIVTAPVFLVFVLVGYVLVRVVKGYAEQIKGWPANYNGTQGSGMRMARFYFKEIKALIRSVENAFQLYLALHFLLLLVTAVLGVFACVEQIRSPSITNHTYYHVGQPKYYRRMSIVQTKLTAPLQRNLVPVQENIKLPDSLKRNPAAAPDFRKQRPEVNAVETQPKVNSTTVKTKLLAMKGDVSGSSDELRQEVMVEVGIEAVLRVLESIVLYVVPLTLILRLQTKLRQVGQEISNLDIHQQMHDDCLFQDQASIDEMKEFVAECPGFTVFGYKMPLFRSFLLSAFAPFVTALGTFLFSYVHVKTSTEI